MSGSAEGSPPPLPKERFAEGVRLLPLVSIDLILRTPDRRILVGLRRNEPAKDVYFVPGGSIRKNETLDAAFSRILRDETGLVATRDQARFVGLYEHFWPTNFLTGDAFGTHYVVLAHLLEIADPDLVKITDAQHVAFTWMSESEMLTNEQVHDRTKAYCGIR